MAFVHSPRSANGGSNGATRTTVATLHVPEPWVNQTAETLTLPPSRTVKSLVQGAVFWEEVNGALQWLALGQFALLLWGFGELMSQQVLWLCWGLLAQATLSKLLNRRAKRLSFEVPCARVNFHLQLQKALARFWTLDSVGVFVLACQTAALWFFYFYQRRDRKDRYFHLGVFPEEGARRFDELLLAGCCLASLWTLSLLWLSFTRLRVTASVNSPGRVPASGPGLETARAPWHCWYVHTKRHPHLVPNGSSDSCGLPAYWSEDSLVSATRGGESDGAMGALAILAAQGPEGRKQVLQDNRFQLLVDNLANGSSDIQVQAAAAIGTLASDALAMKYGATDLVSSVGPLRELARTGTTVDAKEKASGALLNVARSGGHDVQKAIYVEDKLTNQKGLDLLLDLAQNGPTAACKANALGVMAALVPYERARVQLLKFLGFFSAVATHSYSADCKSRAAGVLWNLAYYDSVRVGTEEGVIKALVALLNLPQAQRNATGALANLAVNNPYNRVAIASFPTAIPSLVALIRGDPDQKPVKETQEFGALALANLVEDNVNNQRAVLSEPGALDSLVRLLRTGPGGLHREQSGRGNGLLESSAPQVQEAAARALGNLAAGSPENKTVMASHPALVPGLLTLLKPATQAAAGAQEEAALALGNLAAGSMENQRAIAAQPAALADLVRLLRGPEGGATLFAQEWAAYTLANLSAGNVENKIAIGREPGAIASLVRLLRGPDQGSTIEAQEYAVGALANLAAGNIDNKVAISSEPGALNGLVRLLDPQQNATPGAQEDAVLTLGNLAADVPGTQQAIMSEPGALSGLVRLLQGATGGFTPEAQEWAGYALSNLSDGNVENQRAILAESGAVSGLVKLLGGPEVGATNRAQQWGTHALGNLAGADKQAVITSEGGAVSMLVRLLSPDNTPALQEEAARTLGNLARVKSYNKQVIAAEPLAVPYLMQLLGNDQAVQGAAEQAAWALGNLAAGNAANKVAIASQAGAIPLLVRLLRARDKSPGLRQNCALVLGNLAAGNLENQRAITAENGSAGGLVKLLLPRSGANPKAQEWAAYAIGNLAQGNADNKVLLAAEPGLIPGLVKVLTPEPGTAVNTGAKEEAVLALGNLAAGNAENKAAIFESPGAVTGLARLLRPTEPGTSARAQEYAAGVLRILAAGGSPNKMSVFLGTGAMQGLLDVIREGSGATPEAKEQAERALKVLEQGGVGSMPSSPGARQGPPGSIPFQSTSPRGPHRRQRSSSDGGSDSGSGPSRLYGEGGSSMRKTAGLVREGLSGSVTRENSMGRVRGAPDRASAVEDGEEVNMGGGLRSGA